MAYSNNEWHLRDPEAVASVLGTDIYRGLSKKEAARRRRRDGKNTVWHIRRATGTEYALRCVGDLTAAVLIIAALTSAVFEKSTAAVYICAVVALGILLRTLTYVKTRGILEKMADEGIPSASVIRDGELTVLRADEIVQGDIVLLEAGDVVPCDGRIVAGEEVKVSEKGITENRTNVIKRNTIILTDNMGAEMPCEYRVNMLYAGSSILTGKCRIAATACGEDSLVSMKYGGLLIPSGDEIPLMNTLERWCRTGSLFMLLLVFIISAGSVVSSLAFGREYGFADSFIDAMALAAASVSSYLVTSGYIALAVPLWRSARAKNGRAHLKDAANIEKLAGVRQLIVSDIKCLKSGRAECTAFYTDGRMLPAQKGDKRCAELLSAIAQTVKYTPHENSLSAGEEKKTVWASLAERVTARASERLGEALEPAFTVIDHTVTDNTYGKCDNAIAIKDASLMFYCVGDVRDILSFSDKQIKDSHTVKLTDETRREILMAAIETERRGGVMVALAHRSSPYNSLRRIAALQSTMCFDGFAVIEEEAAPGVVELKGKLQDAGLSVILLSSSPASDAYYMKKLGICSEKPPILGFDKVLSDEELPSGHFVISVPPTNSSSEKIDAPLKLRLSVTNRLSQRLVDCAVVTGEPREAGMITDAVLGSAVSDTPMGPIPQTLKRRAELSVYPKAEHGFGGFAETVRGVFAARGALENLRRSILYLTVSQLSRLACVFLSVICGIDVLHAVGILFLGMILDFCGLLVISFSRSEETEHKRTNIKVIPSAREVVRHGATGSLLGILVFLTVLISDRIAGLGEKGSCSAGVLIFTLVSLVLLSEFLGGENSFFSARMSFNLAYVLYAVLVLVTVLTLCFSGFFCGMLGDSSPDASQILGAVVCTAVVLAGCETAKLLYRKRK